MFNEKTMILMLNNLQKAGVDLEITIPSFATHYLMEPSMSKAETALNYWQLMQNAQIQAD